MKESWAIVKIINTNSIQDNWVNNYIQKAIEEYNKILGKELPKKYLKFDIEDIEHSWDDEDPTLKAKETPINNFINEQNESERNTR